VERGPTLLDRCARAATTSEARFRVAYPNSGARVSRVIALDHGAAALLASIADGPWNGARFLTCLWPQSPVEPGSRHTDTHLRALDGSHSRLSEELAGADVAVMIATAGRAAEAASAIGDACAARGIMTAGLIVAGNRDVGEVVAALRPYASVLVVSRDEDFVPEMLAALRA
jgi:hypothetical protein